MTQQEIDSKSFEYRNYIAERFKDIQFQGVALRNPEDKTKSLQTLSRIADCIDDIKRAYDELEMLERIEPEDEETDNGYSYNTMY